MNDLLPRHPNWPGVEDPPDDRPPPEEERITVLKDTDENGRVTLTVPLLSTERVDRVYLAQDGKRTRYVPAGEPGDPFAFGVPAGQIAGGGEPLERQDGRVERDRNPDAPSRAHGRVGSVLRVITVKAEDDAPVVQVDTDPAAEVDPPRIRVYVNDGIVYDEGKELA